LPFGGEGGILTGGIGAQGEDAVVAPRLRRFVQQALDGGEEELPLELQPLGLVEHRLRPSLFHRCSVAGVDQVGIFPLQGGDVIIPIRVGAYGREEDIPAGIQYGGDIW
jgi:hypothetical protein